MNTALWIAASLLALVALVAGVTKTFIPKEKLEHHDAAAWARDVSPSFVRTLGVLELAAAVGLVLPALVDVAPVLVPITAVCWVLLMLGAMVTHGRLGQPKLVLVNVGYLLLAVFIALGRFGPESFAA